MIITITGKPCSGKSTVARIICEKFGFTHIAVGDIFKQEADKQGMSVEQFNKKCAENPQFDNFVDDKIKELGVQYSGQKYLFDSRLAWHFIPDSFKVYVDLDDDTMAERLANSDREGFEKYTNLDDAKKTLQNRRKLEVERYQNLYDVNLEDLQNYDFVINSKNLTPDEVAGEIITAYKDYIVSVKKTENTEGLNEENGIHTKQKRKN